MWNNLIRYGFKAHIKNYKNISKAGAISVSLLFLIMLGLSFPLVPHTDTAEAALSPTAAVSNIEMKIGKESSKLTLVPTTDSVFATSTDEELAEFEVTTNSFTGYTLKVVGNDDDGRLTNTEFSSTLTSIGGVTGGSVFSNDSEKADYIGKWGFKPSQFMLGDQVVDNEVADLYFPAPNTTGVTLDITKNANTTPNEYNIALGARADMTTPYGVYSKTFKIVAVGNPATYNIIYADNTGDSSVTNMPDATTGNSSAAGIELSSRMPFREDYIFKSWCSEAPVDNVCPATATEYNPGATFYLDQTANNSITLYATWSLNAYNLVIDFANDEVENVKVCTVAGDCSGDDLVGIVAISGGSVSKLVPGRSYYLYPTFKPLSIFHGWDKTGGQGSISSTTDINPTFTIGFGDGEVTVAGKRMTMQELGALVPTQKAEVIDRMGREEAYTIFDSRDNKIYTIAKLKDGEIWMTSNLNLAGGTVLNTGDSDVPTDNYYTLPASSTSGFSGVYNSGNETTNQADCTASQPCNSYYSWVIATAGGRDASGNNITGRRNAAYSICPKGWRLPTAGADDVAGINSKWWKTGDFYELATTYGVNLEDAAHQSTSVFYNNAGPGTVPNFLLAGTYGSTGLTGGGNTGIYWSSTARSTSDAYGLYLSSSSITSASGDVSRALGHPVRCVLDRDPIAENNITTMQDFGSLTAEEKADVVRLMKEEKVYVLKDSRDDKIYNISKLNDGQVWMTSNLNLTSETVLNASDSDVPEDNYFTLPASSPAGFDDDTQAYVYNSGNGTADQADCNASQPCNSYYSWTAATAGSGNNLSSYNNAAYSICPKGWRLPVAAMNNLPASQNDNWKTGDTYRLATAYGADLYSESSEHTEAFYNNAGPGTIPNFLNVGYYESGVFKYERYGYYWLSTRHVSSYSYALEFGQGGFYSASNARTKLGFPVRCLLR